MFATRFLHTSLIASIILLALSLNPNSARAQLGYSGIEASVKEQTRVAEEKAKFYREEHLDENQIKEIDRICQFVLDQFDSLDDNQDGNIDEYIIEKAQKRSSNAARKMWDVVLFRFSDIACSSELRGGTFFTVFFEAMSKDDLVGYANRLSKRITDRKSSS